MSISRDKPSTSMTLDQILKTALIVNRPSPKLHEELMSEIIKGVCLKKTVRLAPKKQDVSNELSMILRRRIAFEISSSSNESLCNSQSDDWNIHYNN
ncbi:Uncharacterized protein FWK35_00003641 [Aphis craccivora]|uniref:Uncharacterized protein n=1 Tax=Aphis craccivora TaxID=307492 RepID=A0A6G0ZM24_APHCR|nr:Uncharacterized protein FWK35_00003641 [Aphis craccivora]